MIVTLPYYQDGHLSATLILVSIITLVTLLSYWRAYRRLWRFPGPPLAGVSRLHSVRAFLSGREHELMRESHEKYGRVVRWQPNLLLINDPSLLNQIYHSRSVKTPHYNAALDNVESVVEAKGWETHRNARRRVSPLFSTETIRTDEILIDQSIDSWIKRLNKEYAVTGRAFDFTNWPGLIIAHISMIRLMGHDYSKIPDGENLALELIDTFRGTFKLVHTLARLPTLKRMILDGPFKSFFAPRPNDGTPVGKVLGFRDQLVEAELQNGTKRTGDHLMNHLLRKAKNTDGTKMGWPEIHDDLNGFLLNPPETTGHTILSTILRVSANPKVLDKLAAEIRSAQISIGSKDHAMTYDRICTLPYLKACVREALRIDPGGVSYLPRWVKSEGWELPDKQGFIPTGTEIASSPWVIGHNKELYGEDVDEYRPERWLEDPEKAEEYAKFDFAWGFGTRRCLGKGLALFGIYKTIFQFFLHFRVEVVTPARSEAYMFWVHKGLQIRLHPAKI